MRTLSAPVSRVAAPLLVALIVNLIIWFIPNRAEDTPTPPGGAIASVSFAPFRDGQSPLTAVYPTPEQIHEDLRAIKGLVAGIRTYTSREGLEVVPEMARELGLKVSMGAWLSDKSAVNTAEVASVIDLANRYPDVIERVIVGNEVLLRRELPPERLAAYIDQVRAAVKQPVAYADVWEFWLKHPEIAEHVDIVTIHLLPYWEDEPTSVEGAMARIKHAYDIIKARFPDKRIMVGEAGWPSAGRTRSAASTGRVEQAHFVSAFMDLAAREGFDYNVIEAFDQSWKQKLEGTVGGHWGLFDTARQPKYVLGEPVVENPDWWALSLLSTALAAGMVGVVAWLAGRDDPPKRLYVALGFAVLLADGLVFGADRLLGWKAYPLDLGFGFAVLALEVVLAGLAVVQTRWALASATLDCGERPPLARVFTATALALCAIGLVWSALLIFDGRYRDFPNHHMIVPVIALVGLTVLHRWMGPWMGATSYPPLGRPTPTLARVLVWMGRAFLILAGLTVIAEGFAPVESLLGGQLPFFEALGEVDWGTPNGEAFTWAALQAILGACLLIAAREPVGEE